MIIYGSLILSLFITFIFYVLKRKEFVWWEFFLPFTLTLITVVVSKLIINYSSTHFTEYWGSNISYVVEEEPYNYWHTETCSYTTCTGSGKDETCTTMYYDCSHQVDVGPSWYAVTNLGEKFYISEKQRDEISKLFGTQPIVIEQRDNYAPDDKCSSSDGTKFENKKVGQVSNIIQTKWNKTDNTAKPYFSIHTYENRIKASDLTVFNIKLVTDKQADSLKLFKYPELKDNLDYPTILSDKISKDIQEKFKRLNGKFGPSNKCRLWVLVFKDKPSIIGNYQENYWVKGNKNELIICIGVDKTNKINWVNSFSWSNSNILTADVKQKAIELNELNDSTWNAYYNYLNNNLQRFQKRSFKEFNYLTVEPSKAAIIIVYILAILISIGCNIWVIKNEFNDENPK